MERMERVHLVALLPLLAHVARVPWRRIIPPMVDEHHLFAHWQYQMQGRRQNLQTIVIKGTSRKRSQVTYDF